MAWTCPGCWDHLQTHYTLFQNFPYHQSGLNRPTNPLCVVHTLTSSCCKPQGQEKQIEPISGVEIALKITTANVEMYYLHPPNPIYFMHILPSKLNTACSLYGKSLWKDSPYLISALSWASRFLTMHRRQSVHGSAWGCLAVFSLVFSHNMFCLITHANHCKLLKEPPLRVNWHRWS